MVLVRANFEISENQFTAFLGFLIISFLSFLDPIKRTEQLFHQIVLHPSKEQLVGRSKVWRPPISAFQSRLWPTQPRGAGHCHVAKSHCSPLRLFLAVLYAMYGWKAFITFHINGFTHSTPHSSGVPFVFDAKIPSFEASELLSAWFIRRRRFTLNFHKYLMDCSYTFLPTNKAQKNVQQMQVA